MGDEDRLPLAMVTIGEPAAPPPGTTEVHRDFGHQIRLLGYDLNRNARSGEALDVTLYWEVLDAPAVNYTLYVALVDNLTDVVAQRDTYPGLGNDPTIYWQPGEVIADAIPVPVAPDADLLPALGRFVSTQPLEDRP